MVKCKECGFINDDTVMYCQNPDCTVYLYMGHSPICIGTNIPWKTYEEAMHTGNSEDQRKAGEMFAEEREKWTRTSSKLARWEKSRKESWAKDKPAWRKQKMKDDPLLGG